MGRISEIWQWVQRLMGIFLLVCLSLYLLRCMMTGRVISFDSFDRFLRGLVGYIFG